jgi:hypothetical protein
VGGDINLPDSDGDTPLYTVESIEVARWMVEHGADPRWKNDEGLTVSVSPSPLRSDLRVLPKAVLLTRNSLPKHWRKITQK